MVLIVWLVPVLLWLFLVGAAIGSFLNVCIYRLTAGKSLIWPGSRCGHCFHEVRLKDNIPLVSYWVLGGRCRDCRAPFSMRYFWVELLTALTLVTLYLLEIGLNVQRLPLWRPDGFSFFELARFPPHSWELFVFHALLACFLIAATACLVDSGRVPASIAGSGLLVGLAGAIVFSWPYPEAPSSASHQLPFRVSPGFYPWPVWGPLPAGLPPRSWQLGLVTGGAGALLGGWGLRLIARIAGAAAGREVLPGGAADLGMIAGAFLGWQPLLIAILLGLALGWPLAIQWRRPPIVGLVLALAIVVAWLGWGWIGPLLQPILFDPQRLFALAIAVLTLAAVEGLLLRAAWTTQPLTPSG